MLKYKFIAIDFDNTITKEDAYPYIGEVREDAIRVMKRIKEEGGKICIWTCRCGNDELKVKRFLAENKIPYDTFNEPFPEMIAQFGDGNPRKVFADIYIDDRSLHAKAHGIDWMDIEKMLFMEELWLAGDTIEAQEDCFGNFKKGEQYRIKEIDYLNDNISFGPVNAYLPEVRKYFKKVSDR